MPEENIHKTFRVEAQRTLYIEREAVIYILKDIERV